MLDKTCWRFLGNILIDANNSCQLVLGIKLVYLLTWESCILDSLLVSDITNFFSLYNLFWNLLLPKEVTNTNNATQILIRADQTFGHFYPGFSVKTCHNSVVTCRIRVHLFFSRNKSNLKDSYEQRAHSSPNFIPYCFSFTSVVRHGTDNIPLTWKLFRQVKQSFICGKSDYLIIPISIGLELTM